MTPEIPKRTIWMVHGRDPATIQREEKKAKMGRERETQARNVALPALQAPPSHSLGPHPSQRCHHLIDNLTQESIYQITESIEQFIEKSIHQLIEEDQASVNFRPGPSRSGLRRSRPNMLASTFAFDPSAPRVLQSTLQCLCVPSHQSHPTHRQSSPNRGQFFFFFETDGN